MIKSTYKTGGAARRSMTGGAIMPPISLAELKKLQKNGKGLYHNEKFDEFCTLMGKVASKWAFTYKRPYQN